MADTEKSRAALIFGLLGWIVAVAALYLNYLDYRRHEVEFGEKEQSRATYVAEISTYDPQNLPPDISNLNAPIRHQFTISHRSGKAVVGLIVSFKSKDKPIVRIDLTDGINGASTSVEPTAKREAEVRKADLLPGQRLSGYVVTEGVTKLTLSTGATDGVQFDPLQNPAAFDSGRHNDLILWAVIGGIALVVLVLLYLSIPVLKTSGIFSEAQSRPRGLALLLLLGALALAPTVPVALRPESIFYILASYLFITRYSLIVRALEARMASAVERPPQGPEVTEPGLSSNGEGN